MRPSYTCWSPLPSPPTPPATPPSPPSPPSEFPQSPPMPPPPTPSPLPTPPPLHSRRRRRGQLYWSAACPREIPRARPAWTLSACRGRAAQQRLWPANGARRRLQRPRHRPLPPVRRPRQRGHRRLGRNAFGQSSPFVRLLLTAATGTRGAEGGSNGPAGATRTGDRMPGESSAIAPAGGTPAPRHGGYASARSNIYAA